MIVRVIVRSAARAMCLVAATGGAAAIAAPGDRPIYAVVRVGSALAGEDRIGAKRAGLMCLPNGVLRWGDVATGGAMDQREVVQDALEDAGLPVTPLGTTDRASGRPALRLRASIRAAGFNLCARHYLGDARAYSGDVALEIEWRVESTDGSEVPHISNVSRHIDESHAGSIGSIYKHLLDDAAVDAAHWLLAPANAAPSN
jgi:hypothetical protein